MPAPSPGQPDAPAAAPRSLPGAVRYARALLWLQGALWALLAGTLVTSLLVNAHPVIAPGAVRVAGDVLALVAVIAVPAACALTEITLARRLPLGRRSTWTAVLVVEALMACLGLLLALAASPSGGVPADILTLAAGTGAVLSAAALAGLLRAPARRFFAGVAAPGGQA